MPKLLSYFRLTLLTCCLCYAGLVMAGVTLTVRERSLGKMLSGIYTNR